MLASPELTSKLLVGRTRPAGGLLEILPWATKATGLISSWLAVISLTKNTSTLRPCHSRHASLFWSYVQVLQRNLYRRL
jgi:hypothetical protein